MADTFPQQSSDDKAPGNIRIAFRGRGGRHRHTQSSAAVLHRSAYSTGSLSNAIQNEYSRSGKFLPLPPPKTVREETENDVSESAAPGTPRDWQKVGAQILGGSRKSMTPRNSLNGMSSSEKLHLTLDLNDSIEVVEEDTMPAQPNLINKFAQEVMRSYPADIAIALVQNDANLASPSRKRFAESFDISDVDTSTWSDANEAEAALIIALNGIRASAAASFEAYRRSKVKSPQGGGHNGSSNNVLKAEGKEIEAELISTLEAEIKGLRMERQRMDVKYARLKEKNGALHAQMKARKEELDQLKSIPAVAEERHRRNSMVGSANQEETIAAAATGGTTSPKKSEVVDSATRERIAKLESEVQEKVLALKSVRKQFVDVLIKQKRAEKINKELQDELDQEKKRATEAANEQAKELHTTKQLLEQAKRKLAEKTEEMDTLQTDFEQQRLALISEYDRKMKALKEDMETKLAEERIRLEAMKAQQEKMQSKSSADMSAALVKQMGQMLKEAIEKSTKKSTQVERDMNNGSDVTVDTKDMFKCLTCHYINASIRLVCHNCGAKRFADLRSEKQRKHIRKQWVNSLVTMYLNMLDEILKTPRGEKVVQGEARHSNRGGKITPGQVRQAEEKIQRMLQAAATQKGRQKFSEVYPRQEIPDSAVAGDNGAGAPPKMKRYVRHVMSSSKGAAAFSGGSSSSKSRDTSVLAPGTQVYAKWWGENRAAYPDWYEAVVASMDNPDSYVVQYQNGTLCKGVPRKDIRTRKSTRSAPR